MSSIFKSDLGLIFAVIIFGLMLVAGISIVLSAISVAVLEGYLFGALIYGGIGLFLAVLGGVVLSEILSDKGYISFSDHLVYNFRDIPRQAPPAQESRPLPAKGDEQLRFRFNDIASREGTPATPREQTSQPSMRLAPSPEPTPLQKQQPTPPHDTSFSAPPPQPGDPGYPHPENYNPNYYPGYYPAYPGYTPYRTVRFYSFMKHTLDIPRMKTLFVIFIVALVVGFLSLSIGGLLVFLFPFCFFISFSFPSLMWISYVYHQGQRNLESRDAIFKALLWGMISTIPAAFINTSFGYFLTGTLSVLVAIAVAPVNEEFFKPLGLNFLKFDINNRIDGLVFGVTCGMGFAMTENLLYGFNSLLTGAAGWSINSFVRGVGSTIIHAIGSGLIGFMYASFYLKKKMASREQMLEHMSQDTGQEVDNMPHSQKISFVHTIVDEHMAIKSSSLEKLFVVYLVAVAIHSGWNTLATIVTYGSVYFSLLILVIMFLYAGLMFLLLKYLMDTCGGSMRFQC